MYICTEDAFPNRRLVQMVSLLRQRCSDVQAKNVNFTDNIYIEHCADIVCISYSFCTLRLFIYCQLLLSVFCTEHTVFTMLFLCLLICMLIWASYFIC